MAKWRDPQFGADVPPLIRFLYWLGTWSISVGRPLFGIRVRLHWTLFLLPLLYVLVVLPGDLLARLIYSVVIFGSLFVAVYLHEIGHAVTALRCGYPVREIVLYIMGGLAITSGTRNVNHDFAIIAFGPFVNFVLLGITAALLYLVVLPLELTYANGFYLLDPVLSLDYLLWTFGFINFVLGVFNLLPLFPLDGAGMLRALLSMKYNPNVVTHRLATIGLFVIVPLIVIFILFSGRAAAHANWFLIAIAVIGVQSCLWERQRARFTQIYADDRYGSSDFFGSTFQPPVSYTQGWQDSDGASAPYGGWTAEDKKAGKPKKPGFFERRRQKRLAQDAQRAAADRAKVEELLEKISRDGITALSEREKQFLKNASKRYQD